MEFSAGPNSVGLHFLLLYLLTVKKVTNGHTVTFFLSFDVLSLFFLVKIVFQKSSQSKLLVSGLDVKKKRKSGK